MRLFDNFASIQNTQCSARQTSAHPLSEFHRKPGEVFRGSDIPCGSRKRDETKTDLHPLTTRMIRMMAAAGEPREGRPPESQHCKARRADLTGQAFAE